MEMAWQAGACSTEARRAQLQHEFSQLKCDWRQTSPVTSNVGGLIHYRIAQNLADIIQTLRKLTCCVSMGEMPWL
jgi:hypothetical protein